MSLTRRISTALSFPILCAALVLPRIGDAAEKPFTNSIGMEFVSIPAGTFQMGSAETDREAAANDKPRHRVTISKPFQLRKYEVTEAQ